MDFHGKRVLITGASRGIGAETARVFAQAGARVCMTARSGGAISALAEELGGDALAVPCDVSRYDSVETVTRAMEEQFGGIDMAICNAGALEPIARMADADPGDWAQVVDVNLKGVFHIMRAVLPGMLSAGGGTILSVGSGAGHTPYEGWSHYCASKAGAWMLVQALHEEYHAAGIRTMSLSPGTVATKMQRDIKASGINPVSDMDWSDHIPPDWPAQALKWMCTPGADAYLGQEIKLRDDEIRRKVGLI